MSAKYEKLLLEALIAIELLVDDEHCFDWSITKFRGEKKLMAEKIMAVYRIAHGCNPKYSCYDVHDDWRKEARALFEHALAERAANPEVVGKGLLELIGVQGAGAKEPG